MLLFIVSLICRYRFIKEIGDGTCGSVFRAVNLETNEIVSTELCLPTIHDLYDFPASV